MNIITLTQATLTMSSREIAELCEKQHGHVCRDIEKLNLEYEKLGLSKIGEGYYTHPNTGNQQHREFLLSREQCVDLITGYRADVRIRINRRWQELEQKQAQPDLTTALNDPTFLRNTLITYSEKVIELTPKANAYDRIATKGEGSLNLTDSAKHLQVSPRKLNQFLFSLGWIYRRASGKSWVAYQDKLKQGYLEHKIYSVTEQSGEEKIYPQVLITAKGLSRLSQLLEKPEQQGLIA